MVNLNQTINGIQKFIDNELLPKIPSWNKWFFGAGVSLMLQNSTEIFNQYKNNPLVKQMNIINKNDEIDLDKLYEVFSEQAKKSAITFDVPFAGRITLKDSDVEKLYAYIKNEK